MIKIIGIAAVLLGMALFLVFYFGREAPPVSLTLASPSQSYTVQLNERVDRYRSPFHIDSRRFPTEVRFTAIKGNATLAANELFWDYESSDERFSEKNHHDWVSESVLKFGWDQTAGEYVMDEVMVKNDSDQTINYMVIESGEHFLILDLAPKASVRLMAHHQTWLPWISCRGAFASGKQIDYYGVNFETRDTDDKPVAQRFTVSIGNNGTYFQNPGVFVH